MNTIIDQDLISIQESRIIAENARMAQQLMTGMTQQQLDVIVEHMADEIGRYAEELAVMSSEETDYGNWQDKFLKDHFICRYLRKRLKGMKCVGIIDEDTEAQTMDIGVPVGVINAVLPATNPVSTTIYNAMIAIKSGNAIIFSPHPRAKRTIARVLDILISIAEEYGLPAGGISYLHTIAKPGAVALMKHPDVSMIMITGVPKMLERAKRTGKPVLYGSAGNGPAFIERTADIKKAVSDIISSKTFDCGVGAASEQSVVVDRPVADEVRAEFKRKGAYFMDDAEAERLAGILFPEGDRIDPEMVGKSAVYLASKAGIQVPEDTLVLISEQEYASNTNPYSREKMCPVLAFYVENDWMNACEKCIELLLSERKAHTLVIHSRDREVIEQFALRKPVARVLINTPAAFGGMGMTTNLFPAMTLGGGSTGRGFTSDNVSPMNLIYIRKAGYGVRTIEDLIDEEPELRRVLAEKRMRPREEAPDAEMLLSMLQEMLKNQH